LSGHIAEAGIDKLRYKRCEEQNRFGIEQLHPYSLHKDFAI